MPNALAFVVFFLWPVVVYLLFRRFPVPAALAWSIIGGYLLLPTQTGLDLPGLPTLDKDGLPVLSAALMILMGVGAARQAVASGTERPAVPAPLGRRTNLLFRALLVLTLVSPVATVLTNGEPLIYGPVVIPGLRLYDAASTIALIGGMVLPFILAQRYLASPESHKILLKVLVLAMLGYSALILFEVRMSPQLNVMVYGFFPHDFLQHMRGDGFRPVVFLAHGLWLAILVTITVLAAAGLWRQRLFEGQRAGQWAFAAIYLLIVLVLSRSLGALLLAVMFLPVILFLGVRGQLIVAGIVALMVLVYPMLRGAGWVPVDRILEVVSEYRPDRAESLAFRFTNEDELSARAAEKPLFGWGMWGRNQIFDTETGRMTSVTDGTWIIIIGVYGWLGYIAQFGLLAFPVIILALRRKTLGVEPATAALSVAIAANLVDLIPNATLTPVTWLLAGALAGRCAYVPSGNKDDGPRAVLSPAARRSWRMATDRPEDAGTSTMGGAAWTKTQASGQNAWRERG